MTRFASVRLRAEPMLHAGAGCRFGEGAYVAESVTLGDGVEIRRGAQVWGTVHIGNDVIIGVNATFVDDETYSPADPTTIVEHSARIGANATILPGVRIGARSIVRPGSVVTSNVPPNVIVQGNPAQIVGYGDAIGPTSRQEPDDSNIISIGNTQVPGTSLVALTQVSDLRGSIVAANFAGDLPFIPRRVFSIFGVSSAELRGAHAHRECHQLLCCLHGSVSAVVDDGKHSQEFHLDRPDIGLHMSPMIWGTQYRYSSNAVLMVLASHEYDAEDYIRDYDDYLRLRGLARD